MHQRRAHLLQARECELHIGLNACDLDAAETRGQLGQVLEQRGLADARLSAEHQNVTAAR